MNKTVKSFVELLVSIVMVVMFSVFASAKADAGEVGWAALNMIVAVWWVLKTVEIWQKL